MVDFKVHIFCGDHTRKRTLFGTTQNPYKTFFNGYILNRLEALETLMFSLLILKPFS
jgi:hypothetical protein